MLKSQKSASKQMEADLALAGHWNKFPSTPSSCKFDWDIVQSLNYLTLLHTHRHTGNAGAWAQRIAAIYNDSVDNMLDLLSSLGQTQRTIHPTTDTKVLLMPTQGLLKMLMELNPDITNAALVAEVR